MIKYERNKGIKGHNGRQQLKYVERGFKLLVLTMFSMLATLFKIITLLLKI